MSVSSSMGSAYGAARAVVLTRSMVRSKETILRTPVASAAATRYAGQPYLNLAVRVSVADALPARSVARTRTL